MSELCANIKVPWQVVDAWEFELALAALEQIAFAFEAGGWDFKQACDDAYQNAIRNRSDWIA